MSPAGAPGAVKVVHLVLGLDVGGLERTVVELLAKLDRGRWAPVVGVLNQPGPLARELEALGVRVVAFPRRGRGLDVGLPVRLARWLVRERAALLHTHNPAPHLYGAIAATLTGAVGPKTRVVHTKHGRNVPHTRRSVLLNQLASALSDRIVTVSDDARAVALEVEGVDGDKVITILNGVDATTYRPRDDDARTAARARLGLATGGYHVVCVARLSEEKDHATLLEAFSKLLAVRPDARLTLIGDGAEREALEQRVRRLPPGAVVMAGMRADVADLLPAFDVFALASRTEGISLTLLEAAAAGLPIVATSVGGNPEVVVHGATGLIVPPGDAGALAGALADLAGRPDRAQMGLRGRARIVARFGAEGMVRAYEQLYGEVLASRAQGAPAPAGRAVPL